MERDKRAWNSTVLIVLILVVALLLRAWKLGEWSLWEDEETSLYFSRHLDKPFPTLFPVFFRLLEGWFHLTGFSIITGRALAGLFGLLSIALTYFGFRRVTSRAAALLAATFLALNLGHLFWSQSIRYYTLVLVFQLLSMYWFIDGFERGRYWELVLSNVAFFLALLTHFSAALLGPVFAAYLAWVLWRREARSGYRLQSYLAFLLPFVLVMIWLGWQLAGLQRLKITIDTPTGADSYELVRMGLRLAVYFGVPVVLLGFLAPFVNRQVPRRIILFFLLAGFLPMLELAVLAQLNVGRAWYYMFFSLPALALLAGVSIVSLHERGLRKTAIGAGSAAVLYWVPFLVAYYTSMHGDRPRWQEATDHLRQIIGGEVTSAEHPDVFATVPGVVAFYLGVDPGETMGNPRVRMLPRQPPSRSLAKDQWYVVEISVLSPEYRLWFNEHCKLEASFAAKSGPKDRTILVYHAPAG